MLKVQMGQLWSIWMYLFYNVGVSTCLLVCVSAMCQGHIHNRSNETLKAVPTILRSPHNSV